jgi:hypothetical protein
MSGQDQACQMAAKLDAIVQKLRNGGYIGGTGSFLSWHPENDVMKVFNADYPACLRFAQQKAASYGITLAQLLEKQ